MGLLVMSERDNGATRMRHIPKIRMKDDSIVKWPILKKQEKEKKSVKWPARYEW